MDESHTKTSGTHFLRRPRIQLLFLVVLILTSIALLTVYIFKNTKYGKQFQQQLTKTQEPTVSLKQEYNNPFNRESQYVNPFDTTKSPFLNLKEKAK